MTDKKVKKVDQHLCYKLYHWKKFCTFYILNHTINYVTLVQLMYSVGNANHAGSVVGKYIFDSN